MFEEIKEIIVEELGVDEDKVVETATFNEDLGADSLDLFELVMAFEDKFDVKIPEEDLEKIKTVGDVVISTEDGSFGTKGNVIDAIKEQGVEGSIIYACGPTPMLRGIKAYAEEMGIEAQISMEERMACGIGACLACVCRSKDVDSHSHVHNKRVCKDGPVFDAREVEL